MRQESVHRYDTKFRASELTPLSDGSIAMKGYDENAQHAFSAHDSSAANSTSTLLILNQMGSVSTVRLPFTYSKHYPGPRGTVIVRAVRDARDELYQVDEGRPPILIGTSASVAELEPPSEPAPPDHSKLLLEAATAADGTIFWINHEDGKPSLHRFADGGNQSTPLSQEPYPSGTCIRRFFLSKDRLVATCQGMGSTAALAQENDRVFVFDKTGRTTFAARMALGIGHYGVDSKGRLLVAVGSLQRWKVTRFDPHRANPNDVDVLSGGCFLKSRTSELGGFAPTNSGGFLLFGSVEETFGGARAAAIMVSESGTPDRDFDEDGAASFDVDPPLVAAASVAPNGKTASFVTFDNDSKGLTFELTH